MVVPILVKQTKYANQNMAAVSELVFPLVLEINVLVSHPNAKIAIKLLTVMVAPQVAPQVVLQDPAE